MKKLILLFLLLPACATTHKVSLHEIREYDQGIKIAESNGIDTKAMHDHLVDMFMSYLKNPGEDPYLKAAKDQANAAQWSAAAQNIQAFQALQPVQPYQPPMSPDQFNQMSGQWFNLPGPHR